MSGICGLIDFGAGFTGKKLVALMGNMQQAMIHRGFERDSLWLDEQTQIALSDCHLLTSRTAVLTNSTAQIHIVYDGDALASTRGDTVEPNQHPPVLAELAHVFADPTKSPIDALRAIDTPFALALWNNRLKKLLLARDAFNAKPLYFASGRGWFAFASELRALKMIPGFNATLDQDAINDYIDHGAVLAPRSIYQGARKVCAGGFVELDCAALMASASLTTIRESDPAASGVVTILAPMCPELHSSIFHYAQSKHDSQFFQTSLAQTNRMRLTLGEQSELMRRALLDSLQQSRFRSSSVHVMQNNAPLDALLMAMCRLELQLETHMHAVADPLHANNADLCNAIAQHLGVGHDRGESPGDFAESLSRIAVSLDEPIGSLDALHLNATVTFMRMNSSHAFSGVGAPFATPAIATQSRQRDVALLNQLCAHHSLAVATPFLNQNIAKLMPAEATRPINGLVGVFAQHGWPRQSAVAQGDVLSHVLRRYFPETLITRIMQANTMQILPRAEQSLMELSESMLFHNDSQVCKLTNRIALRGVLASPAATAREAAQRRWSLLVLEYWLRRHMA